MISNERILIDTNILFYATDDQSAYANAVLRAARIRRQDWQQALALVDKNLTLFQSRFTVLYDDERTVQIWQNLLPDLRPGRPVYDFNLVATMRRHDLWHLFTHNVGDFAAFPDLVLIPLSLPR